MNRRSFNRMKREISNFKKNEMLATICYLSVPHIRNVIGYKSGRSSYECRVLAAILHEYGYQTRIASGEAILIDDCGISVDHRDTFDEKPFYYRGKKLVLSTDAKILPISHHTWIECNGNMIDISVGSNKYSKRSCLFGPLVNDLPSMQKGCSLESILKEAENIEPGSTAWTYREFEYDEYQEYGRILDLHQGRSLGEKWLKTTGNNFVEEWLLNDPIQSLVVDEISLRIRKDLQEIVDSGQSKLVVFH